MQESKKLRNGTMLRKIFSFRLATTEEIKAIIRDLPTNKAAGGEIPVNVLKMCVNYALINGKFPITLKNANVTPVHKKDDPTNKQIFNQLVFCPYYQKCLNVLCIIN